MNGVIHTDSVQELVANDDSPVFLVDYAGAGEFGERELGIGDKTILLSDTHRKQIEDITRTCLCNFQSSEQTYVWGNYAIPTLLARIDCTITGQGVEVYECEERPAGVGVAVSLLRAVGHSGIDGLIGDHYSTYAGRLPTVMRHENTDLNDDGLIFEVRMLDSGPLPDGPILVRAEPPDIVDHPHKKTLVEQSVSTVFDKGDKRHTLQTEELKASLSSPESLPGAEESFVLKPVKGSKARGVHVYLTPADRKRHGKHGTITHAKALAVVSCAEPGTVLQEKFKPPIPVTMEEGKTGNLILRVFTLIHPGMVVDAIGGTYVARRELIVHGASNAVNGPVMV